MSSYTTSLWEVMKSINNYKPMPIEDMIKKARPVIFDFDYETPNSIEDDVFKQWFETTFLTRFALWNIGYQTYEQFHLKLWSKCASILPTYVVKIDAMYRLKALKDRDYLTGKYGTEISEGTSNSKDKSSSTTGTDSRYQHSTLPVNMINANDMESTRYADDANKSKNTSNSESTSNSDSNNKNTITYDIFTGNKVQSIAEFIKFFDDELLNVYEDLFNEFNMLFLGVM